MHAATLFALLPLSLAAPSKRASSAPLLVPRNSQAIEGKYIVRFKEGKSSTVSSAVSSAISSISADADYTYSTSFAGFAASLSDEEVEKLRNNPDVEYLEQDAISTIYGTKTQNGADWGLARLSSQKPSGSTYTYDESAGEGTCSYIIDTGIDAKHPDFEGRAEFVANFVDKDNSDGNGHGTHVAGTIGSKTYGVAKKTKLLGVKVLNAQGSGQNSGILAGMEFVIKDAGGRGCAKGVSVNMSLGGGRSDSLNQAGAKIVQAGHFLAVAAGNDGADASQYSPASEQSACTVGATDKDDSLATYSNIGASVDLLAPGSQITSTWKGGGTNTIDGTSMAAPHVAGLAAYYLGLGEKPSGMCEFLASKALKGAITRLPSSTKNLLINNNSQGGRNATSFHRF